MHLQIDFIQKFSLGKVTFGSLLKRQMSTNSRQASLIFFTALIVYFTVIL